MSPHVSLGPGAEFDAVRALLARWGDRAIGIGDDGAVLDVPAGSRLVVSTDASVEDVHFRAAWLAPHEIGWRATTAALSDLAAMGAAPLGVLLALTVPARWRDRLEGVAEGVGAAAAAVGAPIVGGDVTDGDRLALAVTVLGHAPAPLTRDGARPGDTLYVTGALGGPGAALAAWESGAEPAPAARARFAHPEARVAAGRWLAAHGARAAIDISDGLAGDAAHLAAASGVACVLDLGALPCAPDVAPEAALASGEEYELLVAAPALDVRAFREACGGLALTPVGRCRAAAPAAAAEGTPGTVRAGLPRVTVERGGVPVALPRAHDHFSGAPR